MKAEVNASDVIERLLQMFQGQVRPSSNWDGSVSMQLRQTCTGYLERLRVRSCALDVVHDVLQKPADEPDMSSGAPSSSTLLVGAACRPGLCLVLMQVFSTDQQLAFELQGSSFKLAVGTLQVRKRQLSGVARAWASTSRDAEAGAARTGVEQEMVEQAHLSVLWQLLHTSLYFNHKQCLQYGCVLMRLLICTD